MPEFVQYSSKTITEQMNQTYQRNRVPVAPTIYLTVTFRLIPSSESGCLNVSKSRRGISLLTLYTATDYSNCLFK